MLHIANYLSNLLLLLLFGNKYRYNDFVWKSNTTFLSYFPTFMTKILHSALKHDKQDQQGKAAFNERKSNDRI
jgi:hypothetical protein